MDEPSDEELVARVVAAEDAAAFEILVRRHQSKVRNWLRQLTRDPARADDLAQETFIRAWQRLRTFQGRGKFMSWVMKIAFNSFLQARRRPDYGTTVEFTERNEDVVVPFLEAPDVEKMLAVLATDERHVMILCYAHGMSHGDVAEVLDLPLGTVKSHAQRAKTKIREHFGIDAPAARRAGRG
ncbi:MAG: sigma-70 family RNA polymerase sigma factor [Gammaproteobacteria bacterium]